MSYRYVSLNTPAGPFYIVEKDGDICATAFRPQWAGVRRRLVPLRRAESPVLKKARRQLKEYFAGRRRDFDLPYELSGTDFQKSVWRGLGKIPYGQTRSYGQQAAALKAPKAARAVGRTNGLNPLCVILPCHRVIGSDGSLTGYAGGLKAKKFLLDLEAASARRA